MNIFPKSFEASKWHWLILALIGALVNKQGYQLNDLNVNEDFKLSLAKMVDPGPEGDS